MVWQGNIIAIDDDIKSVDLQRANKLIVLVGEVQYLILLSQEILAHHLHELNSSQVCAGKVFFSIFSDVAKCRQMQ